MKTLTIKLICLLAFLSAWPTWAQLDTCAVPAGPLLPDLVVDGEKLKINRIAEEKISSSSCALIEGCVTTAGRRRLLRFTSSTPNVGQANMHIGDPYKCLSTLFHYSPCHGHLHFNQYADYRLWKPSGYQRWTEQRDWDQPTNSSYNAALLAGLQKSGDLVVGRKQGFCLIDLSRYSPTAGPSNYRSCSSYQGITVGWADDYDYRLDCQFIDITGVPAGRYILEDEVNPERLLPESNYRNNSAAIEIDIPKGHGRP